MAEFSDLAAPDRAECLDALVVIEQVLRRRARPDKVNLASLGNAVPHLHWHIVARFTWDSHFPGAVWAAPLREAPSERLGELADQLLSIDEELVGKLGLTA